MNITRQTLRLPCSTVVYRAQGLEVTPSSALIPLRQTCSTQLAALVNVTLHKHENPLTFFRAVKSCEREVSKCSHKTRGLQNGFRTICLFCREQLSTACPSFPDEDYVCVRQDFDGGFSLTACKKSKMTNNFVIISITISKSQSLVA